MSVMKAALQLSWISEYEQKKAFWAHDHNPLRPHALLSQGEHSEGYFNSRLVIPDEPLMRRAAFDLVELYREAGGDIESPDRVVGPQTGGTKLAEFLADEITSRRKRACLWASPAKFKENGTKKMVFNNPARPVHPSETVLLCDDVITTGGSTMQAGTAVASLGAFTLPFIIALVNRSDSSRVLRWQVIPLITKYMPIWEPASCPLCKHGSVAIPPKGEENWARLNANYPV